MALARVPSVAALGKSVLRRYPAAKVEIRTQHTMDTESAFLAFLIISWIYVYFRIFSAISVFFSAISKRQKKHQSFTPMLLGLTPDRGSLFEIVVRKVLLAITLSRRHSQSYQLLIHHISH